MNDILYKNIDWMLIQGIKFSNTTEPSKILGPHIFEDNLCIITFLPNATKVEAVFPDDLDKTYEFEQIDYEVFGVVTPYDTYRPYLLKVYYGENYIIKEDPYRFETTVPDSVLQEFSMGKCYDIYKYLGSHPKSIEGVEGVEFSVWAPMAQRVSVVGNFNLWDGRLHQMSKIHHCGVFSIFIPNINVGEIYKYEIRSISGEAMLKADPYANFSELRPNTASVVYKDNFKWSDNEWSKKRKKYDKFKSPINILEIHLGTFIKPDDGREFYNYRELGEFIAAYAEKMNYTHIELMPIMEHPFDGSWGYQVTGYFSPTSRYGTPEDFKYMIDYLHNQGIGVILDWVPAHFPKDAHGLRRFDGSALYEHLHPLQGEHLQWGTQIFNYSRFEVSNFLISSAIYWLEEFHIDGLRFDAVSSMLYLNFCKENGEWIANKYGGNDNLEAIEFLQKLNGILSKHYKDRLKIAEESTAWQGITSKDGLGFDYKWNMGWMNDYLKYIKYDPLFRSKHHNELTFSLAYTNNENYLLAISHDEVVHLKKSLLSKMPGHYEQMFANLRLTLGFMITHPGKKLLFMGQDIGEFDEWNEYRQVQWNLLDFEAHKKLNKYASDLNKLYKENKSLYYYDCSPKGFEWINGSYENESLMLFMRKSYRKNELLVIAANFTPVPRYDFTFGVKYKGKYKEIFNSDDKKYGGSGVLNREIINSVKREYDNKPYSIKMNIPPLGISILKYVE